MLFFIIVVLTVLSKNLLHCLKLQWEYEASGLFSLPTIFPVLRRAVHPQFPVWSHLKSIKEPDTFREFLLCYRTRHHWKKQTRTVVWEIMGYGPKVRSFSPRPEYWEYLPESESSGCEASVGADCGCSWLDWISPIRVTVDDREVTHKLNEIQSK